MATVMPSKGLPPPQAGVLHLAIGRIGFDRPAHWRCGGAVRAQPGTALGLPAWPPDRFGAAAAALADGRYEAFVRVQRTIGEFADLADGSSHHSFGQTAPDGGGVQPV